MLINEIKDRNIRLKVLAVHLQSIHLRQLLSYSVRINDFDLEALNEIKQEELSLLRCCCVFDAKISPSLWKLCNVVPFHAVKCLSLYNMGLGCNTMGGREQKHKTIGKYAGNTTYQNRWPMIFRHEYMQLIYLRENGYDNIK